MILLVSVALDVVLNDGVARELGAHLHHLLELWRAELAGGDEVVAGDGNRLIHSVNLCSKHVGVPRFHFVFKVSEVCFPQPCNRIIATRVCQY